MAEYNQPSGQPLPVNPSNKYFGEQDVRHPGQLHWPGVDGYPFLGDEPPLLRQNELQRVPIVGFSYHRVFDLTDENDAQFYQWILDRATNGLFSINFRERRWNDAKTNMIVYMEWTQIYGTNPHDKRNGNGNSPDSFTFR